MASTTFTLTVYQDGALATPTTVEFGDVTGVYGVLRTDTLAVVVADGVNMTTPSVGVHTYTFTEPAVGLTYRYSYKLTHNGTVSYKVGESLAGAIVDTVVIPSSTHYTSQAEVYRRLGKRGAQLHEDDVHVDDRVTVWSDILVEASENIDLYVSQFYSRANLLGNAWVRRKATTLACVLLTSRRGQSALYQDAATKIYDELNEIRENRLHIPGAVPLTNSAPVVRSYRIEGFRRFRPVRVSSTRSTGQPYVNEAVSFEPYWF